MDQVYLDIRISSENNSTQTTDVLARDEFLFFGETMHLKVILAYMDLPQSFIPNLAAALNCHSSQIQTFELQMDFFYVENFFAPTSVCQLLGGFLNKTLSFLRLDIVFGCDLKKR